jgi:hypothetical protein
MLNLIRKSLQLELNSFFELFPKKYLSISKSGFIQNRKKLKHDVFKHLLDISNSEFYSDNDENIKKWKGFRLLSVDLSKITLPITEDLKQYFGITKNQYQTELVQAHSSVLYDLMNKKVLDGLLVSIAYKERKLAILHLKHTQNGDLVIYDRGYPCFELIYKHKLAHVDFLIRTPVDFNNQITEFAASTKRSTITIFKPGKNTLAKDKEYGKNETVIVRLVKVSLDTGEEEILITSLLNEDIYPVSDFKDLYNMRWGIETFFDKLKNKLQVENFTTYSYQGIQQDFYCALVVSNIQSLIVEEVQCELDLQQKKSKYRYKVNENLAYGFLKDNIVLMLTGTTPEKTLQELKDLYKRNTIPIRPERKNERVKDKYRTRKKPVITKNFKRAL